MLTSDFLFMETYFMASSDARAAAEQRQAAKIQAEIEAENLAKSSATSVLDRKDEESPHETSGDDPEGDVFTREEVAPPSPKQISISGTFEDVLNRTPQIVGLYLDGQCPNGTMLFRILTLIGRTGEISRENPDHTTESLIRQNRKLVSGGLEWLKSKVPSGVDPVSSGRRVGADRYRPAFDHTEFDFSQIPTGATVICPVSREGNKVGVLDLRNKGDQP